MCLFPISDLRFKIFQKYRGLRVTPIFKLKSSISNLVNLGQQLTANVFATGSLSTHQTFRRGDNVDSVSSKDLRNLSRTNVDASSGCRYSLQVRDGRRSSRVVTEEDANRSFKTLALDDEVIDIALFFENTGDFKFQLRCRDINARVLR